MTKSTAAVISAFALCIGLLAGVIVMSSQAEQYKEQKRQAEIALEKIRREAQIVKEQKRQADIDLEKARREAQIVIDKQNSVKRAFSREEAGDPHRRFGFEVLYCRKRLSGEDFWYISGEIRNVSSEPLEAELQVVVRDRQGRVIKADEFYVPSGTNAVPGETCVFEDMFPAVELNGNTPDDLTVDVIILNSSMRY
jgi:hypothetical protein